MLIEFIACIPLLALVIAATFYFGWTMRNQQRVVVAARYSTWRHHHGVHSYRTESIARDNNVDTWPEFLDVALFDRRAPEIDLDGHSGPNNVRREWVAEARDLGSAEAGRVAEDMEENRLPRGRGSTVQADFRARFRIYDRLGDGDIRAAHVRDGSTWPRGHAGLRNTILDLYLRDLDDRISGLDLYEEIRFLYRNGW